MRAGSLDKKITIQYIGSTRNDFGEIEQGNYQDFKAVWASINPVSGKESFLSNTNFSTVSHKIKIRYLSGLNASMRIVWKDRIFLIKYFMNFNEANKEIDILCEEQVNGN